VVEKNTHDMECSETLLSAKGCTQCSKAKMSCQGIGAQKAPLVLSDQVMEGWMKQIPSIEMVLRCTALVHNHV